MAEPVDMQTVAPRTQRQIVLDAMQRRPHDPWPRWQGHVILGVPGSPRLQKAYHEPGGGFSPSAGSFGVAVLLSARPGQARTGDELPLAEVTQRYVWASADAVPSIATSTPHYTCTWGRDGDDAWAGDFERRGGGPGHGDGWQLLIRSVGPAGGPVEHLDWDGRRLVVNHRWVVTFDPAPWHVHLGSEEDADWLTVESELSSVAAPDGWGYARILFPGARARMTIRDTAPFFASPLTYSAVKSTLRLDLPDGAFAASLEAQAANLLMGFIGRQTCPGEPTNYPLAWERDGAYAVVAMARCGQIETAKQLAVYFAQNDFFGGFGAEGDAPGSALNALATVAIISRDKDFQRWCWPHVQRKVGLIAEMASATQALHKTWLGPIVPEHQSRTDLPIICQPARDDLIVGSMDLHYPALYISAMSYRGLRQALCLAEVLGTEGQIADAPTLAARLRRGWRANLSNKDCADERTYMTGLWPTWVADPGLEPYRQQLEERWAREHGAGAYPVRPLWTYFTVAEAHQWLFLDRPDVAWKTLRYFWANQTSSGLYTYWEGDREENGFGLWPHLRGWVAPKMATPHYWTAAEMLLFQIDMLAYVSEAGPEPVLVIGGGVPPEWLGRPCSAGALPTTVGMVDWRYDGQGVLDVTLRGSRVCPVRAGSSFRPHVRLDVRHERA